MPIPAFLFLEANYTGLQLSYIQFQSKWHLDSDRHKVVHHHHLIIWLAEIIYPQRKIIKDVYTAVNGPVIAP